jgi:hypothetical protein
MSIVFIASPQINPLYRLNSQRRKIARIHCRLFACVNYSCAHRRDDSPPRQDSVLMGPAVPLSLEDAAAAAAAAAEPLPPASAAAAPPPLPPGAAAAAAAEPRSAGVKTMAPAEPMTATARMRVHLILPQET